MIVAIADMLFYNPLEKETVKKKHVIPKIRKKESEDCPDRLIRSEYDSDVVTKYNFSGLSIHDLERLVSQLIIGDSPKDQEFIAALRKEIRRRDGKRD